MATRTALDHCHRHPDCEWHGRRWIQADQLEGAVAELLCQDFVGDSATISAAVHDFMGRGEVDPIDLATAQAAQDVKLREDTDLLRLQVTQGIDPEAAATALTEVAAELETARRIVTDLKARRVGVEFGEEWWHEALVAENVRKVKAWLDASDLDRVIGLLGIRIRLTGFATFDLDFAASLGASQVEFILRRDAPT